MPRQLTFDLPVIEARGRDDFFVSSANAKAVAMLEGDWPQARLLLQGPEASGKSHLAGIWASDNNALELKAGNLAAALEGLATRWPGPILIENIDAIRDNPAEAEALFHLMNAQAGYGTKLLLTTRTHPAHVNWPTKDLSSRLHGMQLASLEAPDDALLSAILVKMISDRQLNVAPDVIGYLAQRVDRSFPALRHLVDTLDKYALSEGRAITKPLASQVLDILGQAEDN